MIVRISGEGQFRLPDADAKRLNSLDNQAVGAAEAGNEQAWGSLWKEMLALVRTHGEPLGDDELVGSDVIVPPADTTFAEVRHEFSGDGLIPD